MSDDWENEDDPVVSIMAPLKKKWDDEDVEDTVKESWEDSGEDEETEKKNPGPIRPKKVPLAQKIAERKAEQEATERGKQALSDDDSEDPIARKERLRKLELAADIKNAQDLFSGVGLKDNQSLESMKPKTKDDFDIDNQSLESMKPKTKDDFDEFQQRLVALIQAHQKQSFYAAFIESFTRELCVPLRDVDVRKVSSGLTALANEKQKQQREAAKPKKKGVSKPSLAKEAVKPSSKLVNDYATNYDDDFDDDDFM